MSSLALNVTRDGLLQWLLHLGRRLASLSGDSCLSSRSLFGSIISAVLRSSSPVDAMESAGTSFDVVSEPRPLLSHWPVLTLPCVLGSVTLLMSSCAGGDARFLLSTRQYRCHDGSLYSPCSCHLPSAKQWLAFWSWLLALDSIDFTPEEDTPD